MEVKLAWNRVRKSFREVACEREVAAILNRHQCIIELDNETGIWTAKAVKKVRVELEDWTDVE